MRRASHALAAALTLALTALPFAQAQPSSDSEASPEQVRGLLDALATHPPPRLAALELHGCLFSRDAAGATGPSGEPQWLELALLRVLCRVADNAAGFARARGDDQVAVPLGLIGLYWLRLFKPLLKDHFPQSADNVGLEKLGFVKESYRALEFISHLDLRVGMTGFSAPIAKALHGALGDAIRTITSMPMRYITRADGVPVFTAEPKRRGSVPAALRLDEAYLASFGECYVPSDLWIAMQRYTIWIEPAIEAEG